MIQNIMTDQMKELSPLIYQNTYLSNNEDPYPQIKDTMQKIFNQIFSIQQKGIEQKNQQKQKQQQKLEVLIGSYKKLQLLCNELQKINEVSKIKKEKKQYEQKRHQQNQEIQAFQYHTQKQKQKQLQIEKLIYKSKDLINLIAQKNFLQQKLIQKNQKLQVISNSHKILCQYDKQINNQKAYYWKNKKDMCQKINQNIHSKNVQNSKLILSNKQIQDTIRKQEASLQNVKEIQIQLYAKINQFYEQNMKIEFDDRIDKQSLNKIANQQEINMCRDEQKQQFKQIKDTKEISLSENKAFQQKQTKWILKKQKRINYISIKSKQEPSLSQLINKYYLQFIVLALITLALNLNIY